MAGYNGFAESYDILTSDIPYQKRGEYFDSLFQKFGGKKGLLLDLACGTGSLSEVMAGLGYDVIGVDASEEMLCQAAAKKYESGRDILYIKQDMRRLSLYGTVDCAVCALDSLNHITRTEDLLAVFSRVSEFLEPGGLFAFDMNTPYKHEKILSGQTFVREEEDVFCIWQNSECHNGIIDISLDIFTENKDGSYTRCSEDITERAYPAAEISEIIGNTGMELLACYGEDSFAPPPDTAQRLIFLARSTKKQ